MDFIIVYERKQRELENAILIKIELEKRGYTCDIIQYYEASKFNLFNINPPKVILVPHLYGNSSIYRNFTRFGKSNYLLNLQYEQVLSEKWEDLALNNPNGEAQKGFHVCWGKVTKRRLIKHGVPSCNLKLLPALHLDLLRENFRRDSQKLKHELSQKCSLDPTKRWNLFISSFTYADMDEYRLKMNESVAGTSMSEFPLIHTGSRDKILQWFRKILKEDNQSLIIYRPHPDELNFDKVLELEKEYSNFRFIRFSSVKDWIEASDNIYSWYSTSVVESHFLDKPYAILRPNELSGDFDSVLIKEAKFITNYEDFQEDYYKDDFLRKCAISDESVNGYYHFDKNKVGFKEYCDFLEELFNSKGKQKFNLKFKNILKAYITTIAVSGVFLLYKLFKIDLEVYRKSNKKRNFFIEWFIEIDNQLVTKEEIFKEENRLKDILKYEK